MRLLAPWRQTIRRVVLGRCTASRFGGWRCRVDAMATPLGEVRPRSGGSRRSCAGCPRWSQQRAAHAQEHSLEVQLPFLQLVLEAFTLVLLAVGDATPDEVCEALEAVWGGPETLFVISSDLSHFLEPRAGAGGGPAIRSNAAGAAAHAGHRQACGAT